MHHLIAPLSCEVSRVSCTLHGITAKLSRWRNQPLAGMSSVPEAVPCADMLPVDMYMHDSCMCVLLCVLDVLSGCQMGELF